MSPYPVVALVGALAAAACAPRTVPVTGRSDDGAPPGRHEQPLVGIDAAELALTPDWAKRRMLGHSNPAVHLVALDGPDLDARNMWGSKQLVVYWDHADRIEEAAAVSFMQVLQKARADLEADGAHIVFVHASFPGSNRAPMTDAELRSWADRWSLMQDGVRVPTLPLYRMSPDEVGRDADTRVSENLGQSPTILVLDARGLVRWHSEGVQMPPEDALVLDPAQYTIIEAITFVLNRL